MSKQPPRPRDPEARRAKKAVRRAMRRSKTRLGSEYPQLELRPARPLR